MINIKTEQASSVTVLGREVKQTPDMIEVRQEKYVQGIKSMYIPAVRRRQPDTPLLEHEQTAYNSLVAQLAWPARSTMPGLCFDVSDLVNSEDVPPRSRTWCVATPCCATRRT